MAINFENSNRWIRAGSSNNFYQNGAVGRSTSSSTQNVGFYNDTTEHIRFDDAGIVTNVYGTPAIVLRKTQAGNTPNQNPIPLTLTAGTLPSYDVRGNIGTRAGQSCFTAPTTGVYRMSISALQAPNAVVSLLINGTQIYNGTHLVGLGASYLTMASEYIFNLNAGDQVQCFSWNGGFVWGDNGWLTLTVSFVG
jgi:hypothetical protein